MFRGMHRKARPMTLFSHLRRLPLLILLFCLRSYRYLLKPWFGYCCRFHPTCSQYAEQALLQRGVFMGVLLTLGRLLRCHPFHPGGVDHVPGCHHSENNQFKQKEIT